MTNMPPNTHALMLLEAILSRQTEQNELLKTLVQRQNANTASSDKWKKEHPDLAKRCLSAAKKASELMNNLIEEMVTDIEDIDSDNSWDGNFAAVEILDKYGSKIQQFGMVLNTLTQLGTQ